jgi:UDP-N-acetylmuramyl pentapeptide phosphotransferase/UDP-N-acetylglucosamine-1-phosphate transferase
MEIYRNSIFLAMIISKTIILCILLFILSFFFTAIFRKLALKKSIIDVPNDRSSHSIPTPRGGGIAIVIAWFFGIVVLRCYNQIDRNLFLAFLTGLPLTITGFFDDIKNLKPWIKFIVQLFCAASALYFIGGLGSINLGIVILSHKWVFSVIAFVGIVWAINLFNFLDGIDGYISTEIIFIGAVMFVLFSDQLGLVIAVSVLGFLYWNWDKARIFMGDVSSTLLGFNVAIFAIYYQNHNKASIVIWFILTSVFWFDATVTLIRRWMNKEKINLAHRKHAFQRIVQAGFSHKKTVLWALLINIFGFGLICLSIKFEHFSLFFLVIDIILLSIVLKYIDKRKPFEYS